MGANCGIDNLDDVAELNRICNDVGLDTIEAGAALGVDLEVPKVKLFAGLKCENQELACCGKRDFELELTGPMTVEGLLNLLGIPAGVAKIVFVNALSKPNTYSIADGEEVSIFPPVGGG